MVWVPTTKKKNLRNRDARVRRTQRAIDDWMNEARATPRGAFASEAESLAFVYSRQTRWHEEWRRPQRCMFPGCAARSIPRSHALPRSGPLAVVAENGHVVAPRAIDGKVTFSMLGVGHASTFPGFCRAHEAEFETIDRTKDVETEHEWNLQFFRTICWEIRILEHARERFREAGEVYDRLLRSKATAFLRARLGENLTVSKVEDVDWRQGAVRRELERLDGLLRGYRSGFLEPLVAELRGGDRAPLGGIVMHIERGVLPVCLAGRGNFHCMTPAGVVDVPTFLQVFPSRNDTKLGMLVAADLVPCLQTYVSTFSSRPAAILDLVETWMLHGTDHWFLRPSVWNRIPQDRRDRIVREYHDLSLSIGEPATETIFDEARATLVPR